MSRLTNFTMGLIGTSLWAIFIIGLAHSISTGFAGFWGGLPFTIIAGFVICLALYNFWEETIRKTKK
ncbi:hypothetical protein [Aliiruegeria sabulilitoris]|uniref:hypothetical protein n=1 Tax=Aliiruegeria sabulilitoris TaxID=1510458 RepID=UPI0008301CE4|nr:hypothetical protein [Aliiruegeria sabulilitoris]NDR57160.1 hypothetical protein [Pseudoruegeria sp. M32A2M]